MSFIKDSTSRRYRGHGNKKGLSLIEVVLALGIFSIFASSVVQLFISTTVEFKDELNAVKDNFYVNEVFRFIEIELTYEAKAVEAVDNILIVKKFDYINPDQQPVNYIKLEGGNLIIKYYKYGSVSGTNNIIRNVEEFKVSKRDKYIYIALKVKEGILVERCLVVKYVKA